MENNLQDKNAEAAHRERLRAVLYAENLDCWLQPVADEFQGEYPAAYARRLQAVSGFTGSAGMGIFARDTARSDGLLVDGRYTIQAAQEAPSGTDILLSPPEGLVSHLLSKHADTQPVNIGFDPWLHTGAQVKKWMADAENTPLKFVASANAIDACWPEKDSMPANAIALHPENLAGVSASEKITTIQRQLEALSADACVLTLPDGICWLFNVRGGDIDYNPLVLGYAIITASGQHHWYIEPRHIPPEIAEYLKQLSITLHPVTSFWQHTATILAQFKTVMIDSAVAPHALEIAAKKAACLMLEMPDPTLLPKACKRPQEITASRQAHMIDGVAMCTALMRIENQAGQIDELQVMAEIEASRAISPEYKGASFATIAGSGANGAIVHYHASAATNRTWGQGELLLIDSGGQYEKGTTDITRVLGNGEASNEMKDRYTRVLKGHIALANAQFPAGTSGVQLDSLARQFLWQIGCDYDHGTGHGVGAYLCVHEGPQSISKRSVSVPLQAGMIVSNEPGYYKTGAYGIRIENLVCVVARGTSVDGREMLGFDTITMVPINTRLIELSLLSAEEKAWLNGYHETVLNSLLGLVSAEVKSWLIKACAAI